MTTTAERVIPWQAGIESQVDFSAWVSTLKRLREVGRQRVLEEITHTFAEFALKAQIVDWHFSLPKDKEYLSKLSRRGIKRGSQRSRLEVEKGWIPLLEKMSKVKEPSIGLWFYPPGSENEGFDERYGFLYAYDIGNSGEVHAFALRIEPFDDETIAQCLDFLSSIDDSKSKKSTNKKEALLANPLVFTKGKSMLLPSGKDTIDYPIETIEDFFFLIVRYLPDKFTKNDVKRGLTSGFLKEVRAKFGKAIHKIYTKVWRAANGYAFEFQAKQFSSLLGSYFPGVIRGSCPASRATSFETLEGSSLANTNGKESCICPLCGASFIPPNCPYCEYTAC